MVVARLSVFGERRVDVSCPSLDIIDGLQLTVCRIGSQLRIPTLDLALLAFIVANRAQSVAYVQYPLSFFPSYAFLCIGMRRL